MVAAVLAAGLLFFGRRRDPAPRPEPGATLLAVDVPLRDGGGSARFRVREPSDVLVAVDGPPGTEVAVSLGPPLPPTPDGIDRPGPGPSWTTRTGEAGRRFPLFSMGNYVVRVEAKSSPAPAAVHVTVSASPAD